jgi:murein DD-endopeptidase MepM/ murein hydrolase activator NlpD
MSQWSASRSQQAARIQNPQHPAQVRASYAGHGEARGPRQRGANDRAAQSAYTFAHAGRQVRFAPVVFWIVVGTVVILAGWSIASATYLAFRDDVLRTLIAHQAQQQFAYEDRIAELRAQIDRTASRQLLDQEQFERKLDELVRRQALLESHATALDGGIDPITTGSIHSAVKPLGDPAAGAARGDHAKQSSTGVALDRVEKPVSGEIDETSPFGVRMDPIAHEAAMHTGIDFRGDIGDPIHATAGGTVTIAGWTGGYGKLVEIDHGNGLATRYGHLSEIDVEVDQTVRAGVVIGRLGSTGRSTGPHLHYETRVNGEAVNPQKFLDAGDKLFGG